MADEPKRDLTSLGSFSESADAAPAPSVSLGLGDPNSSFQDQPFEIHEAEAPAAPTTPPPAENSIDGFEHLSLSNLNGGLPQEAPAEPSHTSMTSELGTSLAPNPPLGGEEHEPSVSQVSASSMIRSELAGVPAASAPASSEAWVKVKQYNEEMRSRKPVASAAFPFSLLITGVLKPEERERLVDLLSREGVGISELDLEPQFTAARILIPRISEYAGVVIIQAMRSAQVRMMLGPSDSIFATDETRASPDELQESRDQAGASPASVSQVVGDTNHPAESIIVTPDENIRGMKNHEILDTLTASATMKAKVVESENSAAFQDLLENLKRELKYKAYRKGAQGIVHFSVQLMPLQMTASYRVTVMGAAVRPAPAPGEAQATPQQKVRLPSA